MFFLRIIPSKFNFSPKIQRNFLLMPKKLGKFTNFNISKRNLMFKLSNEQPHRIVGYYVL